MLCKNKVSVISPCPSLTPQQKKIIGKKRKEKLKMNKQRAGSKVFSMNLKIQKCD